MISDTLVEGFTFVTFPLTSQPNIYQSRFGDLPGVARSRTRVYGVEQHYLQVFACSIVLPVTEIQTAHIRSGGVSRVLHAVRL